MIGPLDQEYIYLYAFSLVGPLLTLVTKTSLVKLILDILLKSKKKHDFFLSKYVFKM